ncbi:cation:proton antiporter [Bacteriovorax sp. BSW11_IV]|uniref:cation:proton antiporter n=1 Tax=Bacteriovorax sp. BSW11_IV TaxID=1353529 RepID=UPI0009DC27B1|nr:cation:proton antiporter [Bacteriovorax sp. BSW11_IV]
MDHHILMDFFVVAASITVIVTFSHVLRIPTLVGFIATGILIGKSGLNLIDSVPVTELITEAGILLLMFSLGIEFSLAHLKKIMRPLITLGIGQVALTMGVSFIAFKFLLGLNVNKSIIFSMMISLSSTAVILKLLQQKKELGTTYGNLSVTILLAQDLIVLPMMIILSLMGQSGSLQSGNKMEQSTVLVLFALPLLFWLFSRHILPPIMKAVVATKSRELFFFMLITIVFGISLVMQNLGLSLSIGAFLAGVMISESPFSKQALSEFSSFRDNFLGLFFTATGMLLDVQFIFNNLQVILFLVALLFFIKGLTNYAIVRMNKLPHSVAITVTLILAQIGEFSFIMADAAKKNGLITTDEFQYVLSLAILSLIFTPFLFDMAPKTGGLHFPKLKSLSWQNLKNVPDLILKQGDPSDIQESEWNQNYIPVEGHYIIVIGLGHTGQGICHELKRLDIRHCAIDLNHANIDTMNKHNITTLYGDASRTEILEEAHINDASIVIIAVFGAKVARHIHDAVKHLAPKVPVIIRTQFITDKDHLNIRKRDTVINAEEVTSNEIMNHVLKILPSETKTS